MPFDLNLPDEAATLRLGAALAKGAAAGRVLFLTGELGSGKTTLVRGLLRALGISERVKSPTYTLVEPYELSSLHLYHFDFYRLKGREEWENGGFREYFNPQSLCVVEWPERAGGACAEPDLAVHLTFEGEGRRAQLVARSASGDAWLSSARRQLGSP